MCKNLRNSIKPIKINDEAPIHELLEVILVTTELIIVNEFAT